MGFKVLRTSDRDENFPNVPDGSAPEPSIAPDGSVLQPPAASSDTPLKTSANDTSSELPTSGKSSEPHAANGSSRSSGHRLVFRQDDASSAILQEVNVPHDDTGDPATTGSPLSSGAGEPVVRNRSVQQQEISTLQSPSPDDPAGSTQPAASGFDPVGGSEATSRPSSGLTPTQTSPSVVESGSQTAQPQTQTAENQLVSAAPVLNKIALENQKTGTPRDQWALKTDIGDANIQGFATSISTNVGGQVDFKIATDSTPC